MAVKVYPVTKTQDICEDYEVFINGQKADLNTARVSAQPFNRRWPGHQRQIEQTELINFLSFETDEEVEIKIVLKEPSDVVRIRPNSVQQESWIKADGTIIINLKEPAYFTVEPYGLHRALHVFADKPSDYKVDKNAENVLYFGAGEHDVGKLYLKSGQTLFIDEGAVVYATVYVINADDIKIIGRGILDNGKNKEEILFEVNAEKNAAAVNNAKREHAVTLVCCKNVEIDGIVIRDSLVYNIDAVSTENLRINGVKVIGCWRFNSDGIHFANCINGSLTNSFLRTYDDTVCVRGYAQFEYDKFLCDQKEYLLECKNILIDNCVIWNDWGKCLQIGTETYSNEVANVTFKNCKIIRVSGGGSMMIYLVDNAKVHDIRYKNIQAEYDDYIRTNYTQQRGDEIYTHRYDPDFTGWFVKFEVHKHFEYSMIKTEEELGEIRDIYLENIRLYARQKPKFGFFGDNATSRCENITFKKVYWNDEPISQDFFKRQTTINEFAGNIQLLD